MNVTVVGGGVVGLSCALRLTAAGHRVTVVAADEVADTTSAVAAAIWFPYQAHPAAAVLRWAAASFVVFAALAADRTPGVTMRPGRVVHRTATPDRRWTAVVAGARTTDFPGAASATSCTLPVIDMSRYLPWLVAECAAAGVRFERATVRELAAVDGDLVVLAAGLRSGPFVDDASLHPIRGQVVRLADPGLTEWLLDDDNAGGLTYVVPRGSDVVCGGTAEPGLWGTDVDREVEAGILARVRALVPELADAPVLSRAVGLRPGRPAVRLDSLDVEGRRVVCCYGHGGAGVTLSWGCAAEVAALVAGAISAGTPRR